MSSSKATPTGPPSGIDGLSKLWWAVRHPPANPSASFSGKTVLVTGANTGLGFQAAIKYAAGGASLLILGVRSIAKGEVAKAEIVQHTACDANTIKVMQVDMSTFASVKTFANQLNEQVAQLDIALLNAGLATGKFVSSPDGWEIALQVNVLSTALMAILLLQKLRETATTTGTPTHLGFVNSIAHADTAPEWVMTEPGQSLLEKINTPSYFKDRKQYAVVKLLGIYAMQEIAKATLGPDGNPQVIVNASCPFLCKTDLGRSFPTIAKIPMMGFQAIFARTAEQGSRTLVGATTLGKESQGKLWSHDILHPLGKLAEGEEGERLQAKAWAEILDVLEKNAPGTRARI